MRPYSRGERMRLGRTHRFESTIRRNAACRWEKAKTMLEVTRMVCVWVGGAGAMEPGQSVGPSDGGES